MNNDYNNPIKPSNEAGKETSENVQSKSQTVSANNYQQQSGQSNWQQGYQQSTYQQPPYQQPPYQRLPYQQSPYQQSPYQQPPYQQPPYQQQPYQQPPYQQPQYQQYRPPQYQPNIGPQPGQGLATASLICGIFSLVLSFTAFIAVVGLILGVIAIATASSAKKKGFLGGTATAGLVMGIIGTVISGLIFMSCIACFGTAGCIANNTDTSSVVNYFESMVITKSMLH